MAPQASGSAVWWAVVSPFGTGSLGGGHGVGVMVVTFDLAGLGARGGAVDVRVCRLSRETG